MGEDPKVALRSYLQRGRDVLLWKLDGLSEYDMRRPLVPTGTNLLGLVSHAAGIESGYLGDVFGRPYPEPLPWIDHGRPNSDMYVPADQSSAAVVARYRHVWAHADATIEELPLDAVGEVPWWPEERRRPTLHRVLVHLIVDLQRHAGHADILRELIDGRVGMLPAVSNLPIEDEAGLAAYRSEVERVAREADPGS